MDRKVFKTKYRIMSVLGSLAAIWWLGTTSFFLIRDGWHIKAETMEEALCDRVTGILVILWLGFIISLVLDLIKHQINTRVFQVDIDGNIKEELD
jgi:preprotein translocase subunit SecG